MSGKPSNKKPQITVVKANLLRGIYSHAVNPHNLSRDLYVQTADVLKHGVYKGYKGTLLSFKFDTPDYAMISELRTNIYMFSAAKTFQQTLEMTDALKGEDGILLSFKKFEDKAHDIFDKYNKDWLKAEYNTAITSARSAAKYVDAQKYKKTFPYQLYSAVGDEHTCEICMSLDEILLPVDDPFWDDNTPPNHFNCECTVQEVDQEDAVDEGISEPHEVESAVRRSHATKNPLFNFNPGKNKAVFKDTGRNAHPYFEVSDKYRQLARTNFGMEIPEND